MFPSGTQVPEKRKLVPVKSIWIKVLLRFNFYALPLMRKNSKRWRSYFLQSRSQIVSASADLNFAACNFFSLQGSIKKRLICFRAAKFFHLFKSRRRLRPPSMKPEPKRAFCRLTNKQRFEIFRLRCPFLSVKKKPFSLFCKFAPRVALWRK